MNDDNKKDSLSSMNDLFGTKINKEEPVKKEQINESKYEDIPDINKAMLPKEDKKNTEEEQLPINEEKEENNEQIEEKEEKTTKFINEEYVNEKNDEQKPLIETTNESENTSNGMVNELIDIAKNFDFSKLKFNIATIALILSLVGCLFYNLIITIPALLLSLLAYQQAQNGKLDKQSKLISVAALVLSAVGLISIVMSYISRLLMF